jgi:hypothetical protein
MKNGVSWVVTDVSEERTSSIIRVTSILSRATWHNISEDAILEEAELDFQQGQSPLFVTSKNPWGPSYCSVATQAHFPAILAGV